MTSLPYRVYRVPAQRRRRAAGAVASQPARVAVQLQYMDWLNRNTRTARPNTRCRKPSGWRDLRSVRQIVLVDLPARPTTLFEARVPRREHCRFADRSSVGAGLRVIQRPASAPAHSDGRTNAIASWISAPDRNLRCKAAQRPPLDHVVPATGTCRKDSLRRLFTVDVSALKLMLEA